MKRTVHKLWQALRVLRNDVGLAMPEARKWRRASQEERVRALAMSGAVMAGLTLIVSLAFLQAGCISDTEFHAMLFAMLVVFLASCIAWRRKPAHPMGRNLGKR